MWIVTTGQSPRFHSFAEALRPPINSRLDFPGQRPNAYAREPGFARYVSLDAVSRCRRRLFPEQVGARPGQREPDRRYLSFWCGTKPLDLKCGLATGGPEEDNHGKRDRSDLIRVVFM